MLPYIPKYKQIDKICGDLCRSRGVCENPKCRAVDTLQWAHIITRGAHQTRWDLDNCFCLCDKCHKYFHAHPNEFREFCFFMMGEDHYWELVRRSNQTSHIDMGKILYNLKQLKKGRYDWKKYTIDRLDNM
jgi:hypothetical protein